ncbi:MAG: VWA domain-containing protein [Bacteroidia bacterium]|nr:VWA domain-containing protein [Bacteroidia bacterium]
MMKPLTLLILIAFIIRPINAQTIDSSYNPSHNIIQLALLLDVSNSMDGLIDQAKSELWNVVTEVSKANKNGHSTRLEIALYEYGRSRNDQTKGYVKKLLDYTNDLDTISEVLFNLKTNGGDEYCGWVIKDAINELQWRDDDSIYRVIFIAGNEEFNQGKVDYKSSCKTGMEKNIFINTIFCGDSMQGVRFFWKNGADLANGAYFFINSNLNKYDIWTPYDSLIQLYGDSLNRTYWGYGIMANLKKSNQFAQDKNASAMSQTAGVKRSIAKTKKGVYDNSKWDVVDANVKDSTWLNKAKDADLPDSLKGKTLVEKKQIIDSLSKARSRISNNINNLGKSREAYIRENQNNKPKEKTLGVALIEAIRRQASEKGFLFIE